jgi:hypothetical protein
MPRRPWTTRLTVEDCDSLAISTLRRAGVFAHPMGTVFPLTAGANRYHGQLKWEASLFRRAHYECGLSVSQTPKPPLPVVRLTIPIVWIGCYFGGFRGFFLCPQIRDGRILCRKRTSKLYMPPGSTSFGCRSCFNLTYASTQRHDSRIDRLARDPALLALALASPDFSLMRLGLRGYAKLVERLNRKAHRSRTRQLCGAAAQSSGQGNSNVV